MTKATKRDAMTWTRQPKGGNTDIAEQ